MIFSFIIDKNLRSRKRLRLILEELGFGVLEADNPKMVIEFCQTMMPEIILLNWDMPIVNGMEFMTEVRAMPNGHYPKIVLLASENTAPFIPDGIKAGADSHLAKPVDKAMLSSALKDYL